jgi:hypothetical protein
MTHPIDFLKSTVITALLLAFTLQSTGQSNQWIQLGEDIHGGLEDEIYGEAVSLNAAGSIVAIGAMNSGLVELDNAQVQVFALENGSWVQMGSDIIPDEQYGSFGLDLSISADGQTLAVADSWSSVYGSLAGRVRVYQFQNNNWVQMGADLFNGVPLSFFGHSISLSADGQTLAVGSPEEYVNGNQVGTLRVYQWTNDAWEQQGDELTGEAVGDLFGDYAALSDDGQVIAVGAKHHDGAFSNTGQTKVYRWLNEQWQQMGESIEGLAQFDDSGAALALSSNGMTLAIGETHNDSNGPDDGRVRVFTFSSNNWVQKGSDIYGELGSNLFGDDLCMSASGNTIAVGCRYNDEGTEDAGYAKMMTFIDGDWVALGQVIYGENASDLSGNAISMSNDGFRVAIGAHYNDSNAENAGEVKVFEFLTPEISISGNQVDIFNGEAQISLVSGTNFGATCVNSTVEMTFQISNTGDAELELNLPFQIEGNNASDFQISSPANALIPPGESSFFDVAFTPGSSGLKEAQININNNDLDESNFSFSIGGEGIAPAFGEAVEAACGEYTWINGLTYTSSAVDTFVMANAAVSGCDSVVVLNLEIAPLDNSISNMGSYLTANQEGASYQWIYCSNGGNEIQGETNQTFELSPSFLGEFAVIVTLGDCVDTSACLEVTSVGIAEASLNTKLLAYPNPFTHELTMDWQYDVKDLHLYICDTRGRKVYEEQGINGKSYTLKEHLQPGVYFVHLSSAAVRFKSFKILKE